MMRWIRNRLLRYRFERFSSVHRRSRAAIERWQLRYLKRTVPYLYKNVPLYRELLDAHGVNPAVIHTIRDIERLPVMSKSTFSHRFAEEYTDRSAALLGKWVRTSGTSGTPFTLLRRAHVQAPLYGDHLHYRFLRWESTLEKPTSEMKVAHIRVLGRRRPNHMVVPVHEFLNDQEGALRRIEEFAPDILESHASILTELAHAAKKTGIAIRPKYTISGSEQLSDAARSAIAEAFGGKVVNRYGLEEFGTVGVECRRHDGFHVNVESLLVEVVDDDGRAAPEGEEGRILVTDLFNHQMPFIRYETGDRGRISWAPCACGLSAQRVWVNGRHSAMLQLGNQRFHHFEFDAALDSFMNQVLQYQVAKRGERAIVVRIIPGPSFTNGTTAAVRDAVKRVVGNSVAIQVELVDWISRAPRGKNQILIDESTGKTM